VLEIKIAPCVRAIGPQGAKIALVGEAPGEQEQISGLPFDGRSGQELTRMLAEAGITRSECYLTNVLFTRPPANKLELFCVKKAELPKDYHLPPLSSGKYLHPALLPELDRLRDELAMLQPNLIVPLGGTAVWALMGAAKISRVRGTVAPCELVPGLKVLPTYHPAAVMRQWEWRPIVVADLMKARNESDFPEIRRPTRLIHIAPTLSDLAAWREPLLSAHRLTSDVETAGGQITCIGFSPDPGSAYVVPFRDKWKGDYWPSLKEELEAWHFVKSILESPVEKFFQNGLYDLQYIYHWGIRPRNLHGDTMLQHHSLYPEMRKDLGTLGSFYTNESSWKLLRPRGGEETKREE
jgi:uracil-DNA glycosylase